MNDSPQSLKNRMIRAAKLDVALYEEVEADRTATRQAFQVVLLASLATGIGYAIAGASVWDLFRGFGLAVVGWIAWAVIAYWLGTTLFKGPNTSATLGELLRTIGFAQAPGVLFIFVFFPILGLLIGLVVWVWLLIAGVIAVRQALDFSTARALGTCVVGFLIYALVQALFASLF